MINRAESKIRRFITTSIVVVATALLAGLFAATLQSGGAGATTATPATTTRLASLGDYQLLIPNVDTVLNVRHSPGGDLLTTIGPSNVVESTGASKIHDGDIWIQIQISPTDTGWASARFLDSYVPAGVAGSTHLGNAVINTNANVRSTPAGSVIDQLAEGTTISVTGQTVDADGISWSGVEFDSGLRAWIAANLIDGATQAASTPTSVQPTITSDTSVAPQSIQPQSATNQDSTSNSTARPSSSTSSGSCGSGSYINVDGDCVRRPSNDPTGASARCKDGTYSYSKNRRGTCSSHGGVAAWLN